ncbi:identified by fungal homology comparisons and RT-PCR [Nakaseomyces bracarensis]|uniref:Identified by fungal homology comparisons and RT-PCR n=1 Tax=Nakaseomyces bracarensis TaxID=273131 RepID=A0ABR4NYG2_9SACH
MYPIPIFVMQVPPMRYILLYVNNHTTTVHSYLAFFANFRKFLQISQISFFIFFKKKEIAAPEFRVWSPTTLLGQALTSLTTVDRTGNGAFLWIWPQPKECEYPNNMSTLTSGGGGFAARLEGMIV